MSTRTNLRPVSVITNGDMSANITSTPTIMQSITGVGYAFSWSGSTPVGTIAIQVSNDYSLNADGKTVSNAGHWTTLYTSVNGSVANSIPVSGNTGTGFADIEKVMAYAIRAVYTAGSGTGTLQAIVNGKVS